MDPVLKDLLTENLKLAQENNDMLRSMKRRAQWGFVGQIIFWGLFVIAPILFAWGYIAPLMSALGGGTPSTLNIDSMQKILNAYEGSQTK